MPVTSQSTGTQLKKKTCMITLPPLILLDRGARITAALTSTSYYASPLLQGDLEIPCLVEVFMLRTIKNKFIISKYEKLIEALYQEKDGRPVIGSVLVCNQPHEPANVDRKGKKGVVTQQ